MKKIILLIVMILTLTLPIITNAAESITYKWIGSMWGDSSQSLSYGSNGLGYTQDAYYTNAINSKRVNYYFNSNGSISGGGVSIPNHTKYALLRFTMTTPSSLVTSNYTSEFFLLNNWGGGQNCEVVSDFHNEINDPVGSNPDSGMLMRSIVLKCYLDKNATSLSGFAFQISFAPMMATSSITVRTYLSGDIAFLYEETSMTDIETAINNMQNTESDIYDTLTEDHTYNNNASENIGGTTEMNNYETKENQLLNGLDFNGANTNISINADTNNFIWNIVEILRSMNGKIIYLITSVLGLGIIKMILNR